MTREQQAQAIIEEEFETAAGTVHTKLSQRNFSNREIVELITNYLLGKVG